MSSAGEPAGELEEASARFASTIQATLDGVLPGERQIVSRRAPDLQRYVVGPEDRDGVALFVGGELLARLSVAIYLSLDRSGRYLKTVRSDLVVKSVLTSACGWCCPRVGSGDAAAADAAGRRPGPEIGSWSAGQPGDP